MISDVCIMECTEHMIASSVKTFNITASQTLLDVRGSLGFDSPYPNCFCVLDKNVIKLS